MADLLPSSSDVATPQNRDPRVIGVDSEDADSLLSALSSTTARELLSAIHDEPRTPSKLAEQVETSLQNAQYHLEKLEDTDLVEVADTVYSEKGREMNVYAATDQPLVVFAGQEEETSGLKAALSRILSAFGILGLLSLAVERFVARSDSNYTVSLSAGSSDTEVAMAQSTKAASDGAAGLLPELTAGHLFFAGGTVILLVGFAWWYLRYHRS